MKGILHTLCTRFEHQKIYTSVGNLLFAMNPHEHLPLYTASVVSHYARECDVHLASGGADTEQLRPHVFRIANRARSALQRTAHAQAVVIGGESGAGIKVIYYLLRGKVGSSFNVRKFRSFL